MRAWCVACTDMSDCDGPLQCGEAPLQFGVDGHDGSHHHFTVEEVISTLEKNPQYNIRKANREYLSNPESIDYLKENASAFAGQFD